MATDSELVARVLAGDRQGFAELYLRHQPRLSRRLWRILGRREDVEEVVQITFFETYRALPRFDPARRFDLWLGGIGYRQAAKFLAKRRRRWAWLWSDSGEAARTAPDPVGPSPEANVIQKQLCALLIAAMDRLSPEQRIAYALFELEGLTYTEIAEQLEAPLQTIRARVLVARHRVIRHLRRTMTAVDRL